ncbi:GNAT family N-acetyltransferase [Oceanobacillus jeddahense]|uniref:GNAT family N-acetyltransferase n=1 Tax=Oceanobacillus jeddahense TaxID=1462527 RepID=A0ABY5K001_9BACI|nr:GNAT family N-acetyltransferase [Oceanobacillus jeddahense]UUI04631.1 GNAT family N-acetyltransferase [Oceanobacillus jeddahense]
MAKLVIPSEEYAEQIAAYKAAFLEKEEVLHGTSFLSEADSIKQWIVDVHKYRKKETVPAGYAPAGTWLLIRESDHQLLGITNLRFELTNEFLKQYGGHIGYSIHPDERGKGYGAKILELTLKKAKENHLDRVLVNCDDSNLASASVIEANNGKLENKIIDSNNELIRRYWITL